MDESNSQPTRCPCGFFGSPQTLGLCSKCFREREQNQNQAAADMSRPSSSSTDQSRVSLTTSADQPRASSSVPAGPLSVVTTGPLQCQRTDASNSSASSDQTAANRSEPNSDLTEKAGNTNTSSPNCSCASDNATEHRGRKRKHDESESEAADEQTPAKRERSTSNKHCGLCNCRLELAVREIGKCKCGCVFCLLHRLPEQHDCKYDHKEDGRREARAKMVPARKHVGTSLKRLDSDS